MAETTADVRRDIELTRNRMSETLDQLEQKLNVTQLVKDNPWPALMLAVGAGVLLSGSRADVRAAAATVTATRGASGRIGTVLDDLVAQVVSGFHGVVEQRVEQLANEVKKAIGAPTGTRGGTGFGTSPTNTGYGFQQSNGGDGNVPRAD
jgi:Tfp pilus assembly protein FimV